MAHFFAARLSRARKLFAAERLPPPPPAAAERHAPAAWRNLFALEPLPRDLERPATPRRSWLRLLLAPEPLAREPEAPARRRRAGWLRLLLTPERIDPQ